MHSFHGKSVFGGIAIGKVHVHQKGSRPVKREKVSDVTAELGRFREAQKRSVAQLEKLYEEALRKIGESEAAIFEVHRMMLEDGDYVMSIETIISGQQVNAEYAVAVTADHFSEMFAAMDDAYMKERAADVRDVSERLIATLSGTGQTGFEAKEPVIIVAEDLAPSETVLLDKGKVLAFVTRQGSINSHTAILARTMGIPALVQTEVNLDGMSGKTAVVDGLQGIFVIDPEENVLEDYRKRKEKEEEKKALLQLLKGKADITLDGREIKLYANIGNSKDLALVKENDACGIGLFRSEFLYLEKEDYPTEEEQFQIYKTVAETMGGKKVIIRTLDIGADKQAEYFNIPKEENPAMGYRAIRICLDRPEIFKNQLRAIFRASAYGNLAVMYPMIISVEEVRRIKELVVEVKRELCENNVPYKDIEEGIMIETPAAVMVSDELAKEVDFFSIGTNDLTQYTLAIDRQNPKLDHLYDAKHPAVLKMIQMVVDNAHKTGIWAGICGELGADIELTGKLLAMGVDELSVSPGKVLAVRKAIRETDLGNK